MSVNQFPKAKEMFLRDISKAEGNLEALIRDVSGTDSLRAARYLKVGIMCNE